MAHRVVVALAAFHLERDELGAADVLNYVRHYVGRGNRGVAHGDLAVTIEEQDAVKGDCGTGIHSQTFDFKRVAGRDTILFAAGF